MKELSIVLPVLIKNSFRARSKDKSRSPLILYLVMGISFGLFSTMAGIGLSEIFGHVKANFLQGEFVSLVLGISSIACILLSSTTMVSTLYFSKDNEALLALPIKPYTVFFGKIIIVYLTQVFLTVVMGLPILIVYGIECGCGFLFYLTSVLGLLISPLFALMVVSLIAAPLMRIVASLKNKGSISSIVSIGLLVVFFVGYFIVYNGAMNSTENVQIEQLYQMLVEPIKIFAQIFIPFTAIGNVGALSNKTIFGVFDHPIALMINIAIVVGFIIVFVGLALFISSAFYKKSLSLMLENAKNEKTDAKIKADFGSNSVLKAFFVREWKTLIRDSSFATNILGILIIIPIMPVFFQFGTDEVMGEIDMFPLVFSLITGFAVSMNLGASTTFSREGENFSIIKLAPVDPFVVVKAKVLLYSIVVSLSYLIAIVVSIIVTKTDLIHILSAIGGLVLIFGFCLLDVYIDLKKPNLSWVTPTEAVKSSKTAIVTTLIGLAIMFVLISVASIVAITLPSWLAITIVSLVCLVIGGIMTAVMVNKLKTRSAKLVYDTEV